jgi:hypothetical protein
MLEPCTGYAQEAPEAHHGEAFSTVGGLVASRKLVCGRAPDAHHGRGLFDGEE